MPLCQVYTNVARQDIPKDFGEKLIQVVGGALGNSAEGIKFILVADCPMIWTCTGEPSAHVELSKIGLGFENNGKYIKAINPFISETLKIPLDRITMRFFDVKPFEMGIGDKIASEFTT
eukprot:TRINITY_DN2016_c0_g1_i1.p1 TRINITY_DN2016_c0_g1~~TRINITY_DN2016_c0_g1_i1.p1  ORF type:complete len:119 (+),score=16.14 TRINITY_DN2016_c0_g1_i1:80-436(+)